MATWTVSAASTSASNPRYHDPVKELVFDLGAFYWIDTYRLAYSGLGRGVVSVSFRNYRLDFSDGSLAADGKLKWITRAILDQGQTVYGRGTERPP